MEIPQDEYNEIIKVIESVESPVGIDAKKTHVIIIHKLTEIEKRLDRLEERYLKGNGNKEINGNVNENNSTIKEINVESKNDSIIDTTELKDLIENQGNYVLIDVREENELGYGVIPSSKHIPVGDVEDALKSDAESFKLKYGFVKCGVDDQVIFYCKSGSRSTQAWEIAKELGFNNARNYQGSVKEWSKIDPNVNFYE